MFQLSLPVLIFCSLPVFSLIWTCSMLRKYAQHPTILFMQISKCCNLIGREPNNPNFAAIWLATAQLGDPYYFHVRLSLFSVSQTKQRRKTSHCPVRSFFRARFQNSITNLCSTVMEYYPSGIFVCAIVSLLLRNCYYFSNFSSGSREFKIHCQNMAVKAV